MLMKFLSKLRRDERGVSALEYAILAGIIVGAVVIGVGNLGGKIESGFKDLGSKLDTAISGTDAKGATGETE